MDTATTPITEAYEHNTDPGRALDGPSWSFVHLLAVAQSLFYIITGVWPLVSIRSFEQVTGPKTDRWLVKTAGVLITVIGAVLGMAGLRRRMPPEIPVLAVGGAAGLTVIDIVYVARGRISPVYLLDAVVELGLIVAWALAWRGDRRSANSEPEL